MSDVHPTVTDTDIQKYGKSQSIWAVLHALPGGGVVACWYRLKQAKTRTRVRGDQARNVHDMPIPTTLHNEGMAATIHLRPQTFQQRQTLDLCLQH